MYQLELGFIILMGGILRLIQELFRLYNKFISEV